MFNAGGGQHITQNGARGHYTQHGFQNSIVSTVASNSHVVSAINHLTSHLPTGMQNLANKGLKAAQGPTLSQHQNIQQTLNNAFQQPNAPMTNIHGNGIRGPNVGAFHTVTTQNGTTTHQWGAAANLVSGQGSFNHGAISGQGSFSVGAQQNATFTHNSNSVSATASGFVGANAQGSIGTHGNIHGVAVSGQLSGQASAGAGYNASASAAFDPRHGNVGVQGSAGAFAGAQVSATAAGSIGPAHGSVTGHAYAGVGAYAQGGVGVQNGQINFGFGAGAALGVGAGVSFHGSVDAKPVMQAAGNVVHGAEHLAGDAGHALGGAANAVAHW